MLTLLETTTAKDGESIDIYYSKVSNSKAVSLMLRCFANTIDRGFNAGNYIPFGNDTSIVWAENNGIPVGGICFSENPGLLSVYLIFAFTAEDWQRKNIHNSCHNSLENLMRKKNLKYLSGITHINNEGVKRSNEKLGLEIEFYRWHKTVY